jgi:hypothetical protein
MIGNDIVDLHLAEKESCIHRRGFLDKLFLPGEQALVQDAADPAVMVWLLWSCKEAVYKIIHRATHERKFAPHAFSCRLRQLDGALAAGTVDYLQQCYYFRSHYIGSCIHTCAAVDPGLLEKLTVFTAYRPACLPLFYKDEHGVPYTHERGSGKAQHASISHHGKYIGGAFLLD